MAGGKATYLANKVDDLILSNTAYTVPTTLYVGLLVDTNTQAQRNAGTLTEASWTSYARVAVTNNATNFPAASGGSKSNGTAINFATPGSGPQTVVAFGIWDASTAGNLLYWGDLVGTEHPCTADVADLLTSPAHGFTTGDRVKFSSVAGVSIPTGLTDGAYYYVIATGLTTDAFKVSTTSGGSALDITATGGGKFGKSQEKVINSGDTVSFATSALTVAES